MDQAKERAVHIIRRILTNNHVDIKEILLFGSRARGDANPESDWDFLILVKESLQASSRCFLIRQIKRELARQGIPNDIVIQSWQRFNELKGYPGTISRAAALEGISA